MGRTYRDNRDLPHPKPVKKIELSEEHTALRLFLTIFLLFVGAGCIAYAVSSLFSSDAGWCQIESSAQSYHCGEDFTFLYELGTADTSASAEKKAVTALYSEATERAFWLFTSDMSFEETYNIYDINHHPNEELEVDTVLYEAFSLLQDYGNRSIYLAPVYARYDDLFFCTDDSQAADFDPRLNADVAADYAEIAAYASDPESVNIELLGGSRIRLNVSEEYLAYARENSIESFIDFFWLKNAFIADYLAETMISGGCTHGCLSSNDGYIRNLDDSGASYAYEISDRVGQTLYAAAQMEYSGPFAFVDLRDYSVNSPYYYTFQNGETRTPYLDTADGLCRNSIGELTCYSQAQGCAEILLQMIPVYIADSFENEKLSDLADREIYSIYCEESRIYYNDPSLILTDLYDGEDARYTSELLQK